MYYVYVLLYNCVYECITLQLYQNQNQNQKGFNCQEGFYTNQEFGLVIKVHTLRQ